MWKKNKHLLASLVERRIKLREAHCHVTCVIDMSSKQPVKKLVTFPTLQQHQSVYFTFPLMSRSRTVLFISGFHFSERDANSVKHRASVVRSVTWPCCCSRYLLVVQVRAPAAEPITGKSALMSLYISPCISDGAFENLNIDHWLVGDQFLYSYDLYACIFMRC